MSTAPPGLVSAMKFAGGDAADRLDALRTAARVLRDLALEKSSLEERLKGVSAQINSMESQQLPDLFSEAGVTSVGIEAEGNFPAYEARAQAYYHANIAADWPEERRDAAYAWLDQNGHGDIIKTTVTALLGRGERARALEVAEVLTEMKVPFTMGLAVPWTTLTALVRDHVENRQDTPLPLDLLGAKVGRVVKIKPIKT